MKQGSDVLAKYLKKRKMSQAAFASMVGCTSEFVNMMVKGKRQPSTLMAFRIQNATNGSIRAVDLCPDIKGIIPGQGER